MGQWQRGIANGSVQFYSTHHNQQGNPFEQPFERREQAQRRFDPEVIDIEASQSKTVEKKED